MSDPKLKLYYVSFTMRLAPETTAKEVQMQLQTWLMNSGMSSITASSLKATLIEEEPASGPFK